VRRSTRRGGALTYLARVAARQAFPRALAHTLGELRVAAFAPDALRHAGDAGVDLMLLLARMDEEFVEAASADRARLFCPALRLSPTSPSSGTTALLDVALDSPSEEHFVNALCGAASTYCRAIDGRTHLPRRTPGAETPGGGCAAASAIEPGWMPATRACSKGVILLRSANGIAMSSNAHRDGLLENPP